MEKYCLLQPMGLSRLSPRTYLIFRVCFATLFLCMYMCRGRKRDIFLSYSKFTLVANLRIFLWTLSNLLQKMTFLKFKSLKMAIYTCIESRDTQHWNKQTKKHQHQISLLYKPNQCLSLHLGRSYQLCLRSAHFSSLITGTPKGLWILSNIIQLWFQFVCTPLTSIRAEIS